MTFWILVRNQFSVRLLDVINSTHFLNDTFKKTHLRLLSSAAAAISRPRAAAHENRTHLIVNRSKMTATIIHVESSENLPRMLCRVGCEQKYDDVERSQLL
jgi:hypothetical protein